MKKVNLFSAIFVPVIIGIYCEPNIYAQGSWTQKLNFGGSSRAGAVGFSIGTKGYVGTGAWSLSYYYYDFWEYNPSTNVWTQRADFGGSGRSGAVGFAIGSKGYIGTGQDANLSKTKDFYEYNPSTNLWTRKADFGGIERYNAVGFVINGKGYIGTGYTVNGPYYDIWEYDPSLDTWSQKTSFGGGPRRRATAFTIGSKGYVGSGSDNNYKRDFWEYDPTLDSWLQIKDFPDSARSNAISFSINSKGYVGTGTYDTGSIYVKYIKLKDFWEYDPSTDTWVQRSSFAGTARSWAVGFSIGTKGYISTGNDDNGYLKDLWEYDPTGISAIYEMPDVAPLTCYPNPTSGKFTLKGLISDFSRLEIYNVFSELVYLAANVERLASNGIDLSSQPAGIYFLKFQTGNNFITQIIIVE